MKHSNMYRGLAFFLEINWQGQNCAKCLLCHVYKHLQDFPGVFVATFLRFNIRISERFCVYQVIKISIMPLTDF